MILFNSTLTVSLSDVMVSDITFFVIFAVFDVSVIAYKFIN